jgi:hypothetical protein
MRTIRADSDSLRPQLERRSSTPGLPLGSEPAYGRDNTTPFQAKDPCFIDAREVEQEP